MANEIQNLIQAVAEHRETKTQAPKPGRVKSPYGAKIYALNLAWGETKKAHMEQLAQEEAEYKAELQKYIDLNRRWEADNRQPTQTARRGRPRIEYPDGVKIAAAQAIRAGLSKSAVRVHIGLSNSQRLDELLREGEELLQVQELQERDKKVDQAEATTTGEEW